MNTKRITWAEAELTFPGIEAEWRFMAGQDGDYIPPVNKEWRVESCDDYIKVILCDPDDIWEYPPTWFCHEGEIPKRDGMRYRWRSPLPMTKHFGHWMICPARNCTHKVNFFDLACEECKNCTTCKDVTRISQKLRQQWP
jgi:hypothetical protein